MIGLGWQILKKPVKQKPTHGLQCSTWLSMRFILKWVLATKLKSLKTGLMLSNFQFQRHNEKNYFKEIASGFSLIAKLFTKANTMMFLFLISDISTMKFFNLYLHENGERIPLHPLIRRNQVGESPNIEHFKQLIGVVHQVRCNLVHGGKFAFNDDDVDVVDSASKVLIHVLDIALPQFE